MLLEFVKMSGAGNDFIIVDNRQGRLRCLPRLARLLCPRRTSVGADGLLALERSRRADVRMRYFNADGSEAAMCGNGARCLAHFARAVGAARDKLTLETGAGVLSAVVRGDKVKLEMPPPTGLQLAVRVKLSGGVAALLHVVNTGVPHAVWFVKDLPGMEVERLGREIRRHAHFAPAGTNADFAALGGREVPMRTYERGVEGETLACGTGACAVAAAAVALGRARSPVKVRTRSGEVLTVGLSGRAPDFSAMTLDGPVRVTFQGKVEI